MRLPNNAYDVQSFSQSFSQSYLCVGVRLLVFDRLWFMFIAERIFLWSILNTHYHLQMHSLITQLSMSGYFLRIFIFLPT